MTSEILQVAEGQVRCGVCQTQFNALEHLIEEEEEFEFARFLRTTDAPEADDDDTHDNGRIAIPPQQPPAQPPQKNEPRAGARREPSRPAPNLSDVSEASAPVSADAQGGGVAHEQAQQTTAQSVQAEDSFAWATASAEQPITRPLPPPRELAPQEDAAELDLLQPRRRAPSPIWAILALPLVLLLAAQAVHHYRSVLARHPRVGAPLVNLYEKLGLQLTPDWNLHAYEIRQWGVVSDPARPGTLKVRASLTNLAGFAQPYPLLRLVLENRWGDQVRAREFEPAEYLDASNSAGRLLGPAQKVNATITIVDPGPDAEGFRFDVCLRGQTSTVCASDVPARRL